MCCIAASLASAGCGEPPPAPLLAPLDVDAFVAQVQPVLDDKCADPSCHARADRPLALYSPLRRRVDPARLQLIEALSRDEQTANARMVAAFSIDPLVDGVSVDESLVLRKPLAPEAGGAGHVGGTLFVSTADREYRAIRAWLSELELVREVP